MVFRITTWNVNGIRNPFAYQPWRDNRSFEAMFNTLEADIVVMQELKIQRKDLKDDMVLVPGWDCYFSLPKHKKGYSGVGIYTRQSVCAPIRAEEGILGVLCPPNSSTAYRDLPPEDSIGGYPTCAQMAELGVDPALLDAEGRCVVLEFPAFVLFGVYSPANSNGLRDDYRFAFWNALDARIRNLDRLGKHIILTGDLNVSRDELDTAGAEDDRNKIGMTHEEYVSTPNRRIFNQLIEGGEVIGDRDDGREQPVLYDLCRAFHRGRKGMYTHWEQKINARPGNYGSRIDFVLCSIALKDWFVDCNIQEGLMGSDHCPVYAVCKSMVSSGDEEVFLQDIVNPAGIFCKGKRLTASMNIASSALSARLLPEFNKRRSIKDMFKRQSTETSFGTWETALPLSDTAASFAGIIDGDTKTFETKSEQTLRPPCPQVTNKRKRLHSSTSPIGKRGRTSDSLYTKPRDSKSQQTLKGFFSPKQPREHAVNHEQHSSKTTEQERVALPCSNPSEDTIDADNIRGNETETKVHTSFNPYRNIESSASSDKLDVVDTSSLRTVTDSIASKEGWTKLFTKPHAPLCEAHNEPCIVLETKKKGFNCGRRFWICARPVGPTGGKESNTQWRCRTFIWASDVKAV